MAIAFAKEGAKAVGITYVTREESAKETYEEITSFGCHAYMHHVEVTNRESIKDWLKQISGAEGRVDVLVNNAGINRQGPIDTVTEKDWDDIMAVNLKGPFLVSQEILPIMVGVGGGRIINVASVSGLYGGPTTAHYAASKAGLISLTQVLARWGAGHNILVNSISPGIIEKRFRANPSETSWASRRCLLDCRNARIGRAKLHDWSNNLTKRWQLFH